MATRRISSKSRSFTRAKPAVRKEMRGSLLDYFRLGESYTSLILGIIVVIVAAILLVSFAKNREGNRVATNGSPAQETSSTSTTKESSLEGKTYTVKPGDDLWKIAVANYEGNGYAWSEITKANNITDPNKIEVGQKLTLPKVEKQVAISVTGTEQPTPTQPAVLTTTPTPTKSEPTPMPIGSSPAPEQPQAMDKIAGGTYTVVRGDYLWEIAQRAYGDGYQWVKIAQANGLVNPNIIHPGNVFKLPR